MRHDSTVSVVIDETTTNHNTGGTANVVGNGISIGNDTRGRSNRPTNVNTIMDADIVVDRNPMDPDIGRNGSNIGGSTSSEGSISRPSAAGESNIDIIIDTNIVVDQNPTDPDFEQLLITALIYNLALSYHMYVTSDAQNENPSVNVHDVCFDALHLYEESRMRMQHLPPAWKPFISRESSLQCNMRHASLLCAWCAQGGRV